MCPLCPNIQTWQHSNSNHFSSLRTLQWQDNRATTAFSSLLRAGFRVKVKALSSVHPVGRDHSWTLTFQIVASRLVHTIFPRIPSHLPNYLSIASAVRLILLALYQNFSGTPVSRACRRQRRHPVTDSPSQKNVTISQDKLQIYTQHFVCPPIQQCVCQLFGRGHTQQPSLVCCGCSAQWVLGETARGAYGWEEASLSCFT